MRRIAFMMSAGLLTCVSLAQAPRDDGEGRDLRRQAGSAESLRATLDQAVVDGCLMCHRDELSLADRDPEALAVKIAAMSTSQADHLVPIPELSDADREALAEALAGDR